MLHPGGGLEMSKSHYLYGRLHDTLALAPRKVSVAPNIIHQLARGHRRLLENEVAGDFRSLQKDLTYPI